jgi:hypothetical protein
MALLPVERTLRRQFSTLRRAPNQLALTFIFLREGLKSDLSNG